MSRFQCTLLRKTRLLAPVPPPPPAIQAPAPPVSSVVAPRSAAAKALPDPRQVEVRAELARQAALIRAAQTTANATRAAAETAARAAWYAAVFALVGAVLAAVVGWRTGWLTTRTTQQVKQADFRQAWIDSLREAMARFIRLAHENDGTPPKEALLRESLSSIVLRMDREDPDYDQLLEEMDKVIVSSGKGRGAATGDFLLVSQEILKREWEVTKKGLHDTPWGRPWSWVANCLRERRRAEEKEIVRRRREKEQVTPPHRLLIGRKRAIVWKRRQVPKRANGTPLLNIGRLQVMPTSELPTVDSGKPTP